MNNAISKGFIEFIKLELSDRFEKVTQRSIAREIGVSRSMIQWVLTGEKTLSRKVIENYAKKCSLTFDQLLHCLEESQLIMSRPARKVEKSRLNIELSAESRERTERLRTETQADSLSEVIRRALNLYDLINTEIKAGGRLILKRHNDSDVEVKLI